MSLSSTLSLLITVLLLTPLLTHARHHSPVCSSYFIDGLNALNFTYIHCRSKTALDVQFAWDLDAPKSRLQIAVGSQLYGSAGWLAWGVNPEGPEMVGTRALIGIKKNQLVEKDTLGCHTYDLDRNTKRGCPLLPSSENEQRRVRFDSCSFIHLADVAGYYVMRATVFLPGDVYNLSRLHVVWQKGDSANGTEPFKHPTTLEHVDSAETMDLVDDKILSYRHHQLDRVRRAHGVFNMIGWGIILPIGVIVVRYSKTYPWVKSWSVYAHSGIQVIGYFVGAIGFFLGIWLGNSRSRRYSFPAHRIMAIFIFTFATLQVLAIKLRPKAQRLDELRKYWNIYHHTLGYSLLALISFNIFYGISIMGPTSPWTWTYAALLATFGLVVLALELYTWYSFFMDRLAAQPDNNVQNNNNNNNKRDHESNVSQPPDQESEASTTLTN